MNSEVPEDDSPNAQQPERDSRNEYETRLPGPSRPFPRELPPEFGATRLPSLPINGDEGRDGPLAAGTIIADRWEVLSEIGGGAGGRVYRVSDRNHLQGVIQQHRALKVLSRGSASTDRLRAEIAAGNIGHQNLVRTIDHGPLAGNFGADYFLVMDYVGGGTLADLIRSAEGKLDANRARRLCVGVLQGLIALHRRNIIHRDLKPSNILIDSSDGTDERPMLSDFGIAHHANAGQTTLGGAGTLGYAAPEQLRGQATRASDVFAFGQITFELLVGRLPRYGDPPLESLRQELPASVGRLVIDCIDPDHRARPKSAEELLVRLEAEWPARIELAPDAALHRSEAVAQRLLDSHSYAKVIENAAIERSQRRTTGRLEWQCAIACKAIGKNPEAFDCYREAIRLSSPTPPELLREFASFLTSMGRIEDAAEQYQRLLGETTDNSAVREYLKVLVELGRDREAVEVAVRRRVNPDDEALTRDVAESAFKQELYDFAVECATSVDEKSNHWSDIAAIAGLAYFKLDDVSRAERLLIDAKTHQRFGRDAKEALWHCWIKMRKYREAAALGDEICGCDHAWMLEHGAILMTVATEAVDAVRLARIIERLGVANCPQAIIERASSMLARLGRPAPALELLAEEARRLEFVASEPNAHASGNQFNLTISESLKREDCAPGRRARARDLFIRMLAVIRKIGGLEHLQASISEQAIAAGLDGREFREARIDVASSAEGMVTDMKWLTANGGFDDPTRRRRVLRTVAMVADSASRRDFLEHCVSSNLRWREASIALLSDALDRPRDRPTALELDRALECAISGTGNAQMRDLGIDCLAAWARRESPGESPTATALLGDTTSGERIALVRAAIERSTVDSRALATSIACDGALFASPPDRIRALALVVEAEGADPNGALLRQLIAEAWTSGLREIAENVCKIRAERPDGGQPVARTLLAHVAEEQGLPEVALRLTEQGDGSTEFRALNTAVQGFACAKLGQNDQAVNALKRCIAALVDPIVAATTTLFGIAADDVRWKLGSVLETQGKFGEASDAFLAMSPDRRQTAGIEKLAYMLYRAGRSADAVRQLRPRVAKAPRSMEVIRCRFLYDTAGGDALVKDAAALAALRFPWCQRFATRGIAAIGLLDSQSPNSSRSWVDVEAVSRAEADQAEDAWRAIADALLPLAAHSAANVRDAYERLQQLQPIATVLRFQQEQVVLDSIASRGNAAAASRTVSRRLGFIPHIPMRPASELLRELHDLCKDPCLGSELLAHARWAMLLILLKRLSGGKGEVGKLAIALCASRPYKQLDTTPPMAPRSSRERRERERLILAMAATEVAAGLQEDADERVSANLATLTGIGRVNFITGALRAGWCPSPSQWSALVRWLYFIHSPRRLPSLVRKFQLALAAIATIAASGFAGLSYAPRTATIAWSIGTLSATFAISAIFPVAPRESAWKIVRSPQSWDARVSVTAVLLVIIAASSAAIGLMVVNDYARP